MISFGWRMPFFLFGFLGLALGVDSGIGTIEIRPARIMRSVNAAELEYLFVGPMPHPATLRI